MRKADVVANHIHFAEFRELGPGLSSPQGEGRLHIGTGE